MKNKKQLKNENAITLIALVITILVLLILAGVTIATLTGDNGILTRTQEAKYKTEEAEEQELRKLTRAEATTYLEDYEYMDNSTGEEKTITIPAQCAVSQVKGENTLKDGLVIIDANGNEWVWIEVPKSEMPEALTFVEDTDYTTLETALQTYVSDYRQGDYRDIWYSEEQNGFKNKNEYDKQKNKMLKSIYDNAGFFIGRYETGTRTQRSSSADIESEAIIQKDVYPYNYITCKKAQELSEGLALEGKESSLLFGIQSDLVLKYIENNSSKTKNEITSDSTSWGNYKNSRFEVSKGKYTLTPSIADSWLEIHERYLKNSSASVLLTTGATERSKVQNIYDLAGNVWEWSLEYAAASFSPCTFRGGGYNSNGNENSVKKRLGTNVNDAGVVGFRSCLY